jgi:hypothetical protein
VCSECLGWSAPASGERVLYKQHGVKQVSGPGKNLENRDKNNLGDFKREVNSSETEKNSGATYRRG